MAPLQYYKPHQTSRYMLGNTSIWVLVLLVLLGGALLFTDLFTTSSDSSETSIQQESVPDTPTENHINDDHPTLVKPTQIAIEPEIDPESANSAEALLEAQQLQQNRLDLMKEKAQEYTEKRLELLQKCKDYEALGMLEEKKLECLDYLAEKRADLEVKERQELRKKLKNKFEQDNNG